MLPSVSMGLAASGFLTADGRRLEYALVGPPGPRGAPTLVLLHEGLGCVSLWRDFPAALAARTGCRVLVYSRAGYGASDPVPLPRPVGFMHDEALRSLPEVLEAAAITDAILVGHSDGASIALIHAAAARTADRVRAVALLAPHVFVEDLSVRSIAAAAVAYQETDLRARLLRHHGDNVDCAFWGWNRVWLDPGFRGWNLEAFLPRVTVPLLVIQGVDDEYGTEAQVAAIAGKSGGPVETLLLPGCGHSPHRDQREATLDALSAFVAAAPRRRVQP